MAIINIYKHNKLKMNENSNLSMNIEDQLEDEEAISI
jgi:hypothetical protein